MKLSDCKTRDQVNKLLEGGVWNLNGEQIARDQIIVKRHKGVYVSYVKINDCWVRDCPGELYSSPEEAQLAQIEGWIEYLEGKNKELRQKMDKNNRELKDLESKARDLKLYLAAQRNQDAQREKAKAYKKENWK